MDKKPTPLKTVVFTGHRPQSLGGWKIDNPTLERVSGRVYNLVKKAHIQNGATIFINGGAAGFDLIAARAVLDLKAEGYPVQLWTAAPYPEQGERMKYQWKDLYDRVIKNSDEHIVLFDSPKKARNEKAEAIKCLFARNEWMIRALPEEGGLLIACFDGLPSGRYMDYQIFNIFCYSEKEKNNKTSNNKNKVANYRRIVPKGGTAHAVACLQKKMQKEDFDPVLYVLNPGD